MKKVKLMLTAIAILAMVGGTLAFKAKRFGFLYCTSTVKNGRCAATALIGNGVPGTGYYTTTFAINLCAQVTCPKTGFITVE